MSIVYQFSQQNAEVDCRTISYTFGLSTNQ